MKTVITIYLMYVTVISQIVNAKDNWGNKFLLLPSYTNANFSLGSSCSMLIYMITDHNNGTKVHLSTPRLKPHIIDETMNLDRLKTLRYCAPPALKTVPVGRSSNTIMLTADEDITVSAGVTLISDDFDLYMVYPVLALGTEYYVMSYYDTSFFTIIVAEMDAEVTIAFQKNPIENSTNFEINNEGRKKTWSDTMVLQLKSYMAFQVAFEQQFTFHDLSGTEVTATAPIAVTSGIAYGSVPVSISNPHRSRGHGEEQLTPVGTWGKEFVWVKSAGNSPQEILRIYSLNGTVHGYYETNGERTSFAAHDTKQLIELVFSPSEDNILVRKLVTHSPAQIIVLLSSDQPETPEKPYPGDVTLYKIVPNLLFDSYYVWSAFDERNSSDNYFIVVIQEQFVDDLIFDRMPYSEKRWARRSVSTNDTSYVRMIGRTSSGVHMLRHIQTTVKFGVYVAATHTNQMTSYTEAGMLISNINRPCTTTLTEVDDGVDNDCDGRIDEETNSQTDDDEDGQTGEDLARKRPVNGGFSPWAAWKCEVACEAMSDMKRTRVCNSPVPAWGGKDCLGSTTEISKKQCDNSKVPCQNKCPKGRWGSDCAKHCEKNCHKGECHNVDGQCVSCAGGYRGDYCNHKCSAGSFGPGCRFKCRERCERNTCNRITGACSDDDILVPLVTSLWAAFVIVIVPCTALVRFKYSIKPRLDAAAERDRQKLKKMKLQMTGERKMMKPKNLKK